MRHASDLAESHSQSEYHPVRHYAPLEDVLKFSRPQSCWQGFLKQLPIKKGNVDTNHLDAWFSVIHTLLKQLT